MDRENFCDFMVLSGPENDPNGGALQCRAILCGDMSLHASISQVPEIFTES